MSVDQPLRAASAPTTKRRGDGQTVPVLVARPGGAAERFADALGVRATRRSSSRRAARRLPCCWPRRRSCSACSIVHVLVSGSGLGLAGTEESFNEALVDDRSGTLTTVLRNRLAGRRRPGPADPRRPHRPRLCRHSAAGSSRRSRSSCCSPSRPPTASRRSWFPETDRQSTGWRICRSTPATPRAHRRLRRGLLRPRTPAHHPFHQQPVKKALAWTGAILLTTFVALSRMYRGMHHPLDVAGGVLVGIGAILVLLFACRAAGAAAERRS